MTQERLEAPNIANILATLQQDTPPFSALKPTSTETFALSLFGQPEVASTLRHFGVPVEIVTRCLEDLTKARNQTPSFTPTVPVSSEQIIYNWAQDLTERILQIQQRGGETAALHLMLSPLVGLLRTETLATKMLEFFGVTAEAVAAYAKAVDCIDQTLTAAKKTGSFPQLHHALVTYLTESAPAKEA